MRLSGEQVYLKFWGFHVNSWCGVHAALPQQSGMTSLWCMRHDTVTSPQNETFPNWYIFSSVTSFSAVALHEITQFCWFVKKTQRIADIMTEDVEQGTIDPIATTWAILQSIPTISHGIFCAREDQLPGLGQEQHCWNCSRDHLSDVFSVIAKLGAVWHFLLWVGQMIFH